MSNSNLSSKRDKQPFSCTNSASSLPTSDVPIFCLNRTNYIIMGCAALLILLGFLLMAGPSCTMEHFEPDVFSLRRSVIAPTLSFFGYLLMVVGIMKKTKTITIKKTITKTKIPNP
ncbi:MAG: DUF3098 domain-containing protein [Bacteroidales bacterium]|nr:DUF3098 domain-containing protein [Bacteroidales bacterium]